MGSDSDIRLDWTGSFRRFESVDSESALDVGPGGIPPQPLRPAPNVTPPPKNAHPSLVPPVPVSVELFSEHCLQG